MCPAGEGRSKGYQDCKPCAPGSYNDGTQTTQPCTRCPEGYTSSESGATDASGCTGIWFNTWARMYYILHPTKYYKELSTKVASGCPGILKTGFSKIFIKVIKVGHNVSP